MKVYLYNNAKCGATAWNDDTTYEAPCDFSDINAAIAWLEEEIDVKQQAIAGSVYDLETGEIYATCSWDDNDVPEEDDPYDVEWDDHYWDDGCPVEDYDADIEMGFNPYLGAYDYDC